MTAMLENQEMLAKYELVVGLEVHAQLNTESKLFCGCSTAFGADPNTHVCPVCLGHPGTIPALNQQAFDKILKLSLAFACKVPDVTYMDRKNYYYPDLPKNYQISQEYDPIGRDGEIQLINTGKSIGIHNVHLEEDAGKLIHPEGADDAHSYVDLNRAGTPLAEIVTYPVFRALDEIDDFMESLRTLLLYLDVCDGRMEQGSLRFEASVSVREFGAEEMGKRSEIKNLNSMKSVLKGVQFEYARQVALLESGGVPAQETRLWDDNFDADQARCQQQWQADCERPSGSRHSESVGIEPVMALLPENFKGRTRVMRSKEEAADYRYFPEPDLPRFPVTAARRDQLRAELPALPGQLCGRYTDPQGEYRLKPYHAQIIVKDWHLQQYFQSLIDSGMLAKKAANLVTNQVLALVNDKSNDIETATDCPVRPVDLIDLQRAVDDSVVTANCAFDKVFKDLVKERMSGGEASVKQLIEKGGYAANTDQDEILGWVKEAIAANEKAVEDLKKGKKKARGAFMGYIMKKSRGKAPPKLVNQLLDAELKPLLEE